MDNAVGGVVVMEILLHVDGALDVHLLFVEVHPTFDHGLLHSPPAVHNSQAVVREDLSGGAMEGYELPRRGHKNRGNLLHDQALDKNQIASEQKRARREDLLVLADAPDQLVFGM